MSLPLAKSYGETTRVIVGWLPRGFAMMDVPMALNENDQVHAAVVTSTVTASRLDSHEKVCADRYNDIKTAFQDVHSRLNKIMYGVIALLLAVVGWLITHGPWVAIAG